MPGRTGDGALAGGSHVQRYEQQQLFHTLGRHTGAVQGIQTRAKQDDGQRSSEQDGRAAEHEGGAGADVAQAQALQDHGRHAGDGWQQQAPQICQSHTVVPFASLHHQVKLTDRQGVQRCCHGLG